MDRTHHPLFWPTIARVLLGSVWITGAIWNVLVTLPEARGVWDDLGENATFGVYRWFFDTMAGGAPAFWTIMVIAAELMLGVLLLGRDPWARYGLLLSTAWCVFLFFLIWPWTLSTIIFLGPSVWLLRYRHPIGVMDLLHRHPGDVGMRRTGV